MDFGKPGQVIVAREFDRQALRRAVADETLQRLRRGVYRVPATPSDDRAFPTRDRYYQALARAEGVHRQLRADHWLSHETAALLHGCFLWRPPERTHVIQAYRASARAAPDIARHTVDLPDAERCVVGGLPATSLERAVADCATSLHPLHSLVIADSAIGLGLDVEHCRTLLAPRAGRPGTRRAEAVLDLADGGAQSPWETWTRYVLLRAGLPRPRTQIPIRTRLGLFHADLGWDEWRLAAEFDGRVKYRRDALGPDYDPERALIEEKRRGEAIQELWTVERFMSGDRPDDLVARVVRHVPAEVRTALRVNPLLPPP